MIVCSTLDKVTQLLRQYFIARHARVIFLDLNKNHHLKTVKMYGRKVCNQLYSMLNIVEISFLNACTLCTRIVEIVLCLFYLFVKIIY
jgi:hypothetical protein